MLTSESKKYKWQVIMLIIKSKALLLHAMVALGGREGTAYSFLTSVLDRVSGQHHAPAALYTRGKGPLYPLDRRLGGPQSQYGCRG
jgi:hypothetical protein